MSAYIIFNRLETLDVTELQAYAPKVAATLEGHNATKRAGGGQVKILEGVSSEAVVILEFPSVEEAEAWYHSPRYQEASVQRLNGAKWHVMIVEGT